jgi:hypothetical protein
MTKDVVERAARALWHSAPSNMAGGPGRSALAFRIAGQLDWRLAG